MGKPLTIQTIYVLLALLKEDTHAYDVYKRIAHLTNYMVMLAPIVVKRILDRAIEEGWISSYVDNDRTLYHLEEKGYRKLRSEMARLKQMGRVWDERSAGRS